MCHTTRRILPTKRISIVYSGSASWNSASWTAPTSSLAAASTVLGTDAAALSGTTRAGQNKATVTLSSSNLIAVAGDTVIANYAITDVPGVLTVPTATYPTLTAVNPSIQTGSVAQVQVTFNQGIAAVCTEAVSLTLNGTLVPLTSDVVVTPDEGSMTPDGTYTRFNIKGLGALTEAAGIYSLTVNGAIIPGAAYTATTTWQNIPSGSLGALNPSELQAAQTGTPYPLTITVPNGDGSLPRPHWPGPR